MTKEIEPFSPGKTEIVNRISAAVAEVCKIIEECRGRAAAEGLAMYYTVKHGNDGSIVDFDCNVWEKNK